MKKYLRGMICILYTLIRFCTIKLIKFNNFQFSPINIISPFTQIEIGRKGKLSFGKKVKIRSGSKIRVRKKATMKIGNNTSLNHNCIFTAHKGITIGENVQFGPNVLIYDHDHDFRIKNGLKELKYKVDEVTIGNNVWIGANVVILRGTKIADNCVIGAGCVIKGYFEENTIITQERKYRKSKIVLEA